MKTSLPDGIVCCPTSEADVTRLHAVLDGPPDSPYEGGRFSVDVKIPEKYPFEPPTLRFLTKIYHPNIDENGRICLSAIQLPPGGTWKPCLNICSVLTSLRAILADPKPDDPLMAEIGEMLQNDKAEFLRLARQWTKTYATGHSWNSLSRQCLKLSLSRKKKRKKIMHDDSKIMNNICWWLSSSVDTHKWTI